MFGMVDQTLQENTDRLNELREEIKALEEEAFPLQSQQTELALKMIAKVSEAWNIKLRQMFPSVPFSVDTCLAEVKPTDNVNKAPDLEKAVKNMGVTVTRIEHDKKRNCFRIYGGTITPPVA
jgi:hypothetical protein